MLRFALHDSSNRRALSRTTFSSAIRFIPRAALLQAPHGDHLRHGTDHVANLAADAEIEKVFCC